MFKNYLKVAFRNLWRKKGFSLLNISGLAIGMASAILLLLWIRNELSYDRFHDKGDRIYEAWNRGVFSGILQCWNTTPKILGPTAKLEYPEVESTARAGGQWFVTAVGDKKMSSRSMIVDSTFLRIFSFPMIEGDAKSALTGVYSIVITEKMAKKMFGDEPAMNRVIKVNEENYKVSGILKDLPPNTRFDFEFLLPWAHMLRSGENDTYWGNNSVNTFILLKPNTDIKAFNEKIKDITINHSGKREHQEVFLHPSAKWHLYSRFENGKIVGGQIETVRMLAVIAAFILLIACINFMNLTTARSEKRAKEVGIRKVAGADKKLLVMQFIGESLLIAVIAGIIALLLVELALPAFRLLVNRMLSIPYSNIYAWLFAIAFILFTGLLAGSYPAFFLSSFQPVAVLKGTFKKSFHAVNPRKVLVVLQFSFAIVLIISTFITLQQIRYAQQRELGYNREQLVYHWFTGEMYEKYPLIKQELLQSGIASHVTKTLAPLTFRMSDTWDIIWKGKAANDKTDFERFSQDEDLVATAGLQLAEGRDMDLRKFPTDSNAMLLNETAVKAMGFKKPIGQLVTDGDITFHVVGVVKDFILNSPFQNINPMVIEGAASRGFNVMHMRLSGRFTVAESVDRIEKIFARYNPAYPFECHFIDQDYALKFDSIQRTANIFALFASLAIFISCLGLFGLAAYMAEARTKEIGVRKVLGASVFRITRLLSADFLKLIAIAIVIAIPVAWYIMNGMLQELSYRVPLYWWVFAGAALLSILISMLTIGYQSIKAARANPVRSLRTE